MKPGTIPSPRQLKLARFDQNRSTYKAKRRAEDWVWQRAIYRLRRWFKREIVAPLRRMASRPIGSRQARALQPSYHVVVNMRVDATAYRRDVRSVLRAVRTLGRRSSPSRSTARPAGAHRLDQIGTLSSKAYMGALDARQRYVTANLLRLKGLTARVAGEPSWREARRADRYAAA